MAEPSATAVLARSLQDNLGTSDLSDPEVRAAVDGVMAELAVRYRAQVTELEAEIARRDAVDRYRQALAEAGAILHDTPPHIDLAAEMTLLGVPLFAVRSRICEIGLEPGA